LGGFSTEQLRQARDADLIRLAEQYGVTLRRSAVNEVSGACPRCGGRDRFSIKVKERIWFCRHCGGPGNKDGGKGAIDLVMLVEDCGFVEAVQRLTGAAWTPSAKAAPGTYRRPRRGP
jgi:phage/plasmid primase-like uncharacterized protein